MAETSMNNKKLNGLLIALAAVLVIGGVVLTLAVVRLAGSRVKPAPSTTRYETTTQPTAATTPGDTIPAYTTPADAIQTAAVMPPAADTTAAYTPVTELPTLPPVATDGGTFAPTFVPTQTTQPGETTTLPPEIQKYTTLVKTGDNYLSDDPDNEFIAYIAKEKKVDPELLVAIYAVPDQGNNFVLEFNGERDAEGNVIKSPDTLKTVYNIGLDKSIKQTSGKITGNVGMNYAEGMLSFGLVQEVVMAQYPDYFTGVEDRRPNH